VCDLIVEQADRMHEEETSNLAVAFHDPKAFFEAIRKRSEPPKTWNDNIIELASYLGGETKTVQKLRKQNELFNLVEKARQKEQQLNG
jgi:hypothetical protein